MTELDLYKFIHELTSVEMRWDDNVLSCWVSHYDIEEFAKLIESSLEDGGRECSLRPDGTIWLDLVPICSHYGIDPERIFPKTNS